MNQRFVVKGEKDLLPVVKALVPLVIKIKKVLLYGDLGAGKTTFVRHLCSQLGVTDAVSSPTFAIINVYRSPCGQVNHMDLYRLHSVQEVVQAGVEDYIHSGEICLIEWPEVALPVIDGPYLKVNILHQEQGRVIEAVEMT